LVDNYTHSARDFHSLYLCGKGHSAGAEGVVTAEAIDAVADTCAGNDIGLVGAIEVKAEVQQLVVVEGDAVAEAYRFDVARAAAGVVGVKAVEVIARAIAGIYQQGTQPQGGGAGAVGGIDAERGVAVGAVAGEVDIGAAVRVLLVADLIVAGPPGGDGGLVITTNGAASEAIGVAVLNGVITATAEHGLAGVAIAAGAGDDLDGVVAAAGVEGAVAGEYQQGVVAVAAVVNELTVIIAVDDEGLAGIGVVATAIVGEANDDVVVAIGIEVTGCH